MKARSAKTERKYRLRRVLVARLLAERPYCEILWDQNCTGRATDVDEIQSRAALGSILQETNLQVGCRNCHTAKHEHPAEAMERGLTRPSWWKPADTAGDGQSRSDLGSVTAPLIFLLCVLCVLIILWPYAR